MTFQLVPLAIGIVARSKQPHIAQTFLRPLNALTGILSLVVLTLITALQFRTLAEIRAKGYVGICVLIFLSLAAGWIAATQVTAIRKAVSLTTATRDNGVALVIATASFPGAAVVTIAIIFAIAQTIIVALVAFLLGRLTCVVINDFILQACMIGISLVVNFTISHEDGASSASTSSLCSSLVARSRCGGQSCN